MKLDSFYTPPDAAKRLVDRLDDEPENVADFCAGEGELLRACVERFPAVRCVALDKSKRASSRLLAMNKTWEVHCADFLNERKMSQTGLNNESFDLVVMNPPFSCRGTRYKIDLDGLSFSGSKALLFLARALQYLRIGGVLRAILPTGVVCAERDAEIVGYLKRAYGFRVFAYSSKLSFCGKSPNVVFAEVRKPACVVNKKRVCRTMFETPPFMIRGCLNVVEAGKTRVDPHSLHARKYVHTTDLREGTVQDSGFWVFEEGRRGVVGPAVLLPRVGTPSKEKICIIPTDAKYVLSDCVIALQCSNDCSARKVRRLLLGKWDALRVAYNGTGAKYITLQKLARFIDRIGGQDDGFVKKVFRS